MSTPYERPQVPDKVGVDGLEAKWVPVWESTGAYRFDRTKTRDEIYSIDTPPPTVSGSLHIGHVFSFTQTDIIARFKRMRGLEVFYPMGWDDNGLPTERRVQNHFGVRCEPSLPYDPDFRPPEKPGKRRRLDLAAELRRAVRIPDGDRREGLRAAVAAARAVGRLDDDLPDDRARLPADLAARVPAQPRPRRGLPGRSADALGRHVPHRRRAGRAGGPRTPGRVPRPRVHRGQTARTS